MAEAIGPGTPLICVKWTEYDRSWGSLDARPLEPGALYFCEEIYNGPEADAICPWGPLWKNGYPPKGYSYT